jgi:translation initiation factor IF-2
MTKIRVYQLAKELGVDNNELIERIKALRFDVKNHMSTLSEGEVDRIRAEYHRERAVAIDEKRILPTVIRRRRVKVEEHPAGPAPPREAAGTTPAGSLPLPQEQTGPLAAAGHEALSPEEEREQREGPLEEGAAPREEPAHADHTLLASAAEEGAVEMAEPGQDTSAVGVAPGREEEAEEEDKDRLLKPEKGKKQVSVLKKLREDEEEAAAGKKAKMGVAKKVIYPLARKMLLEDRARQLTDSEGYLGRRGRVSKEELEIRKKRILPKRPFLKPVITTPKPIKRKIKVGESITIADLAKRLSVKASEVIKKLMQMGVMASVNQSVDFDTAVLVSSEFGYEVERLTIEESQLISEEEDRPEQLVERPPVVTIMGHVNHGKTRLLDTIRKTNVVETEAGGITQHIGAYTVQVEGKTIVFIDTPGHEAFTKMRARGAKVTDIVVLVVAADDGVMPQTIEAIHHAKAAGVPIIVAINKIDLPDANPERVRQALAEHGLVAESWGGETLFAEISARENIGVQELLELILLQAEMMEIKANPYKKAKGVVLEAKLDRALGPVVTVLVQEGTLKLGDPFVVGHHFGKVRALLDDRGARINEAGPSIPVEVLGASGVPEAGDLFLVLEEERKARMLVALRSEKAKAEARAAAARMTLEQFYDKIKEGQVQELNVILKADVQGSLEALSEALSRLSNDKVRVKIVHGGVGGVTETDIMLASASNAVIIGFNVRGEAKTVQLAEQEKVDIRFYSVIYDAVSDIRRAMEGMLAPTYKEVFLGRAEVRELFHVPKVGTVAGSYVLEGKMERNARVRIIRDNKVVHDGRLSSLRRFKDDVKEVAMGYECGIGIENFNDIKTGDIFESYTLEQVARPSEASPAEKRLE